MAQNKAGAQKMKNNMIKKYGKVGYSNHMKMIGRIGGSNGTGEKGFKVSGKAITAGSLGGKRSKLGHKFLREDDNFMYYINKTTGKEVKYARTA